MGGRQPKKKTINTRKFISIFIVLRNSRIKSFFFHYFFFIYHLQWGRKRGKLKRHAFPSRRDALQDGLKWSRRADGQQEWRLGGAEGGGGGRGGGGGEIHKVHLSTVFLF